MRTAAIIGLSSFACFGLMTMSLFLCVYLLYIPQVDNRKETTCIVTDCDVTVGSCSTQSCTYSTTSSKCTSRPYTCYHSTVYFKMELDGRDYTSSSTKTYDWQSSANSRCNEWNIGREFTCYYDERSPGDSLSMNETGPIGGGIAAVVIFSIFAFGCLASSCVAVYYIWKNS